MRNSRITGIFIAICVIALCVFAVAGQNQLGVANSYKVTLSEKTWVADTLLPRGDYEIRHVMEGENHIMVFHQLGVRKPAEVRATCVLITLAAMADHDEKVYLVNAANERVLQELTFKGDSAKHVLVGR